MLTEEEPSAPLGAAAVQRLQLACLLAREEREASIPGERESGGGGWSGGGGGGGGGGGEIGGEGRLGRGGGGGGGDGGGGGGASGGGASGVLGAHLLDCWASLVCEHLGADARWLVSPASVPHARRRRCRSRHCAGCSAAREGSSWAYSRTASRSSGRLKAPSWARHGSPPPPLEAGPAGTGGAPHSGHSRSAQERLEALLDEVAHAGAAPVAASVKREIVRQHLQLQVFEAVPA
eukprot:scaffold81011_cov48-Phaeocystis_antarctica.AAC.1